MDKVIRWVFILFYPIFMIVYYLIMRGVNINSIVMIPVFALLSIKAIVVAFRYNNNQFVKLLSIFLIYSLFTGVFYLVNDIPFSCYTGSMRQFVFPIIFAYLGCCYSSDESFNKWYLIACAVCFVVGFYLYAMGPSYYLSYITEARSNLWYESNSAYLDESNILESTRFSSFFTTSYVISFFSVPALILSLSYSLHSDGPIGRPWCYVIAVISFIAALLCQQRIAIAFAFLVILFFGIFSNRLTKEKKGSTLWLVYLVVGIIAFFVLGRIANLEWFVRISELVGNRFDAMNFFKAMSERSEQYSSFDRATGFSYIFGLGLGSCGHLAGATGLKAIHDGEFLKLFYEFGFVGCVLLTIIVWSTLKRGIKDFKRFHPEVIIIIFYLVAGLGSDSLSFFVYSAMFWFSMGRIWNTQLSTNRRRELNHLKSYGY